MQNPGRHSSSHGYTWKSKPLCLARCASSPSFDRFSGVTWRRRQTRTRIYHRLICPLLREIKRNRLKTDCVRFILKFFAQVILMASFSGRRRHFVRLHGRTAVVVSVTASLLPRAGVTSGIFTLWGRAGRDEERERVSEG